MNCITGVGIPDTRYVASPEFITTILHYFTIFEVPILSYGTFIILFKTPKRMSSVKWLMLNLHIWSALSDLLITFFGIPYILLPAPAGYGLGLVNSPRLMIYLMVTLLAGLTVCVIAISENRFFVLFAQKSWWAKVRKPYLIAMFTTIPLVFVPPYFDIPEQQSALNIVLSKIPCQPPFTVPNREIFVIAVSVVIPVYSVGAGTLVFAVSISVFTTLVFLNLLEWKLKSKYSIRTFEMQKKFAISLAIQSAFILSFVLAPVLIIIWIVAYSYHDQALNNFVFIILSLHGAGSTIVMIFVHKPYRDYTLSKFLCCSWARKLKIHEKNQCTASVIL